MSIRDRLGDFEGTCRSCGAEIYRTTTEHGKYMPVDRYPVEGGNIALEFRNGALYAIYKKAGPQDTVLFDDDSPKYVSHFVSCPQAESWRKK